LKCFVNNKKKQSIKWRMCKIYSSTQ
jgi:hypothetical protein